MADFRKCIPVLAVLALILGMTTTASAQTPFTCSSGTGGVSNDLRWEGLTELVGDIVIQCTGGDSALPPQPVNITVFVGNTTITSRLVSNAGGNSEAVLLINEPATGTAVPSAAGGVAGATLFGGTWSAAQPNAMSWFSIPVSQPGGTTLTIRIKNIRINANTLGTPTLTAAPIPAVAFISVSPFSALPITNNAQQVVGYVRPGLNVTLAEGPTLNFQQCVTPPANSATGTVRFAELFGTAFKPRFQTIPQDVPSLAYLSESGYFSGAAITPAGVGTADFGTRLRLQFANVPAGTTISAPTYLVSPGGSVAVLVASESAASAWTGGVLTPTPAAIVSLTTSGNTQSGMLVYEVIVGSTALDSFDVPVTLTYTANPGSSPAVGITAQALGSFSPTFAPVAAGAVDAARTAQGPWATSGYPIPRFTLNPNLGWLDLFRVNVCATNLLFPFVTNQIGFDTGIAIANTSQDIFGTTTQTGDCTLNWFGDNAPAATAMSASYGDTEHAAGTVRVALASGVAPNFQGYMIARCTFQFAHGFAFVSDLGARNIAMGYLALVIPDQTPRVAGPLGATDSRGEQLAQ